MRGGASTATLVEQDDAINCGIKKTAVILLTTGARSPVNKEHGNAAEVAAFFDIQFMNIVDFQFVGVVGVDFRKKRMHKATNIDPMVLEFSVFAVLIGQAALQLL
jgi:hypothetical protein